MPRTASLQDTPHTLPNLTKYRRYIFKFAFSDADLRD